jgi:hypothetical protein
VNELLQTNIFFFIASLSTIVISIGICVLLYYLVPLVRDARDMMAKIRIAAEEVEDDFEKLKDVAEEEGAKGKAIADVVLGFVMRALSVRAPRKRKKRLKRATAK